MTSTAPEPTYRKDYLAPSYWIDTVDLRFELGEETTRVTSRLALRRNPETFSAEEGLRLDGEDLKHVSAAIDGRTLDGAEYEVTTEGLTLKNPPEAFVLETVVEIEPQNNHQLSGLYKSSGNFCTQCEAEGFRRITYMLDRPDVMACYTVAIVADPERYPVLLSNGNPMGESKLEDGRREVRWEDPFKKPSYLFALVAGQLACHAGTFTTRSGREVKLEIWVEPRNIGACEHALDSLRRSMKWDEEVFGLEYDLDIYMIVAVGDFNMGAMENKGLNVFNSKFVLAQPETATDRDYENILAVIGHEYFHNWTGNRVTCKDWFQLTLKEGLTVFRDQQFSADMGSAAVTRIDDVVSVRLRQFPEDAGPMSHPIRPESYISMDNFYTATVYEKGAEVIRMYQTLLGQEGFRRGMDLYFERHDGSAVTCDDFRAAMADANGRDLGQFGRWYTQNGTPRVEAEGCYDPEARRYSLTLRQLAPEGMEEGFEPMHIPVATGLVEPEGKDLPLRLAGEPADMPIGTRVLELTEAEETFTFEGIHTTPVPSVLRGFSAPVVLRQEREDSELSFLAVNDSDSFNRWEAGQELFTRGILRLAADWDAERELVLDPLLSTTFERVLEDPGLDGSLKALALSLPAERRVAHEMEVIDPDALHNGREFLLQSIATAYAERLFELYHLLHADGPPDPSAEAVDARRLKNTLLGWIGSLERADATELAATQYHLSRGMTDREAALRVLVNIEGAGVERGAALHDFYQHYKEDPLVIDKWFQVQAEACLEATPANVEVLTRHPDFSLTNPNRVRSLVGAFAMGNQVGFHAADGRGYRLLADHVIELDALNPQVAARLAGSFNTWRRFDAARQELIGVQLERLAGRTGLSKDTFEIVSRALAAGSPVHA